MVVLHCLSYLIVPVAFLLAAFVVVELGLLGNRLGHLGYANSPTVSSFGHDVFDAT